MPEPTSTPTPAPAPASAPTPVPVSAPAPVQVPDPVITHPDPPVTTIPAHTVQPTSEEKKFIETIPEAYRDKAYLKGVNNTEDLYKKLDGAQELIGKKTIDIPGPDTPEPEREAFYNKIRPETAEGYEFQIGDPAKTDKAFVSNIKGLFHKAGLSKGQAATIQIGFDQIIKDTIAQKNVNIQQQDADFDKMAKDMFGTNTDAVLANSKSLLEKYSPESMGEYIKNLSNENLIVLSSVLEGIRKDFISEDDLANLGPGSNTTEDIPALRDKARKIMASEAFSSTFHKDHQKVQEELKEIYSTIGKLERLGKR